MLKYLIEKGACVEAYNHEHQTPLHKAALYNNLESMKTLLDAYVLYTLCCKLFISSLFRRQSLNTKNSKWVLSGNTTLTYCRQTSGTSRKSHTTNTRHQEDILSKATSCHFPIKTSSKTRMDTKIRTTKHRTITESHNGSKNEQRINNNRIAALERTAE